PDHWPTVGPRTSPLSRSPRLPITPAHSILSYLLGVAATEARLACFTTGLDSALGVLHADQKSPRDSMALDILEAIRPDIDAPLLGLLRTSVFRQDDFMEGRRGQCRIVPPLTDRLAATAPHWAELLAPVVEGVARALADAPRSGIDRLPTRLTQANRSAGRDEQRRRPPRPTPTLAPSSRQQICRGCGMEIAVGRRWCDRCRPSVKLQAGRDGLAAARALRARLHEDGLDPATSPASRAKQKEA